MKNKAALINHTNLSPTASDLAIKRLCLDAREQGFRSVCVLPVQVPCAAKELTGTEIEIATVIGFPLGGNTQEIKLAETLQALQDEATAIELCLNVPRFKSRDDAYVEKEITSVVKAARKAVVKVIIDEAYFDREEMAKACKIAQISGAQVIKASTGFSKSIANLETIAFIRHLMPELKIEACGGIYLRETMETLLAAGADYLATSAGMAIMQEYRSRQE
ncbi:MAG: deoxyribose-phosphate aldolase [Bacillota bacterium]|jgi:deoxyribose-phosphate aldolase